MQRHPAVDEQQKVNCKMGIDWDEILEQIDKTTVPTQLVKKIVFQHHSYSTPLTLYIDPNDSVTMTALGPLISTIKANRANIEVDIDVQKMSRLISQAVKPILDLIPKTR